MIVFGPVSSKSYVSHGRLDSSPHFISVPLVIERMQRIIASCRV